MKIFFASSQIDANAYLNSFAAALPSKMKVSYLRCYVNDEIVALAFLQKFRFAAASITDTNPLRNILIKSLLFLVPCRLSFCGSLFCIALPGMAFKQGMDNAIKSVIIDLFIKQEGSSITVMKDIQNEYIFNSFRNDAKCFPSMLDSTMEMNIPSHWKSMDDYLNALHHKYRQRAKKVMEHFEGIRVQDLCFTDVEKNKDIIYRLYLNVVAKQSFRIGKVDANYFVELKRGLKEKFIVTGYFLGDKLIAFRSAFIMDNRIEIHFIGFDYNDNKTYQIYFNILYDNIAFAITKKAKVLELGRTAQDAKRIVGALPKYFSDLIFFKSSFFKKVFDFIYARYNNNGNVLPERNPFKEVHRLISR